MLELQRSQPVKHCCGAAIDKGESNNYMLTVELIHVKGNADVNVSSEVMSIEGDTLLDAVRRFNSITGKRAYWAHIRSCDCM